MLRSRNNRLSVSLLAMTALVLPASSYAAELNTSPLYADIGQSYHATNQNYSDFAYCRINLHNEAGTTVRADLVVFHGNGAFFETLALSEAR
jgi:hypothetical protein